MNENMNEREEYIGESGDSEKNKQNCECGHIGLEEVHPTVSVYRPAETRQEHDEYQIRERRVRRDQIDVGLRVVFDFVYDQYDR